MTIPQIVAAEIPGQGRRYYLVDDDLEFYPEVKAFLDWKAATCRAPGTLKAYCERLLWYYRFLHLRDRLVTEMTATDLTDYMLWLQNPLRRWDLKADLSPHPLRASTRNLLLQAVHGIYAYLVRIHVIDQSPVCKESIRKSTWHQERDLLAYTRRSPGVTERLLLKQPEERSFPKTISRVDFTTFLQTIHVGTQVQNDPSGYRDRVLCHVMRAGGFRLGKC